MIIGSWSSLHRCVYISTGVFIPPPVAQCCRLLCDLLACTVLQDSMGIADATNVDHSRLIITFKRLSVTPTTSPLHQQTPCWTSFSLQELPPRFHVSALEDINLNVKTLHLILLQPEPNSHANTSNRIRD